MALHLSCPQQAVLTRDGHADEYADLLGLDRRGEQLTPEQQRDLQEFKARADDIRKAHCTWFVRTGVAVTVV